MSQRPVPVDTVLFDLDGTLCDTAPDLAFALNSLLQEQGRPPLPYAAIRSRSSHGGLALVQYGFQMTPEQPEFAPLRQRMLEIYAANIAHRTRLFAGMEILLSWLEQQGLRWGVVTNKPSYLTLPLLQQLQLAQRAACIVSGDTTAYKKPHPEPALHACRQAGAAAAACLLVGDAQRDIQAGAEAGMKTMVALYGYLGEDDRPDSWGADAMVDQPQQIIDWLCAHNARGGAVHER